MYVKLDLLILRRIKSKYSVALYELMKDYQNLGGYRISVEDFRKLMGIQPGQYEIFTMLRKRVLDKAVDEINGKTDLFVAYDLEKVGRKTLAVLFKVKKRNQSLLPDNTQGAIEEKLKGFGIKTSLIKKLIKRHKGDYLWANIAIVEEQMAQGNVRNPTAYLLKAFQENFIPEETEYSKRQKKEAEKKKAQQQERENKIKAEKEKRKAFQTWKAKEVKRRLNDLSSSELENLFQEYIGSILDHPIFSKMYEAKGFENPIIQDNRHRYLEPQVAFDEGTRL